jgi:hypothetical protein
MLRHWADERHLAMPHLMTSHRLSPLDPLSCLHSGFRQFLFIERRFDEAVSKLLLSTQKNPGHPSWYRFLAASYAIWGGSTMRMLL